MIDTTPRELSGEQAWRALEAQLRPFVARRIRVAADVDDVVQEVFVRIQRNLPQLRDEQRFGPWVYQMARNAIVDHLRAAARHPLAPSDGAELAQLGADHEAADAEAADAEAVEQEVAGYAAFFITLLPSPYREALTLTELQGLSQREAAEMLGTSVSGMKSRVQRGRHKLRTALEDCCHIALDARQRVIACEPRSDGRPPEGCCNT